MAATLIEPIVLVPTEAESFRQNINDNFANMKTNAAAVNADVDALRSSLAAVATSGNASDLITDATHRVATDTQIENWGKRLTVVTTGSPITASAVVQDDTDITATIRTLLATDGSWKPTKTTQLQNDAGFITADSLTSSKTVYIENVTASEVTPGTPLSTEFPRQWSVRCADGTTSCTPSMVPTVVFNQEDSMSGNWAQVSQSGDGVVYIWSKADTSTVTVTAPTLKAVYATEPVQITE